MKRETKLINGSTLITQEIEGTYATSVIDEERIERRLETWADEAEARLGHGRLCRELTATISEGRALSSLFL